MTATVTNEEREMSEGETAAKIEKATFGAG